MLEKIKNNTESIDSKNILKEKGDINKALEVFENKSKKEIEFKNDTYLLSLNFNLTQEENPNLTQELSNIFNKHFNIV